MIRALIAFAATVAMLLPAASYAASLTETVRGRILLDVEANGEAWYVDPVADERYYLGRPADAFAIMRERSLGISDANLAKIPEDGSGETGDAWLRDFTAGRILLQAEANGEAWYVHPVTKTRHYLGRPTDAFAIMRSLSLGISSVNLTLVPVAADSLGLPVGPPSPTEGAAEYRLDTVATTLGSFVTHVVRLDRSKVEMRTTVAENGDCTGGCAAIPLEDHVKDAGAFAGIHGTYFCPPDYAACTGKTYSFLPPVFDSDADVMRNESLMVFHDRPMIAATSDGDLAYFHRDDAFGRTVADYEATNGETVTAAIGNWPSLVEFGANVTYGEPSEPGFLTRARRGGIGWNDAYVFLLVTDGATIPEFAEVFRELGADYAMNLDGGGSAALYLDGVYRVGPGRLLPNAVTFRLR